MGHVMRRIRSALMGPPAAAARAFRRVGREVDLRDLHVYGGAVILTGGVWVWSPPAAAVVFGGFLVFLGLALGQRRT